MPKKQILTNVEIVKDIKNALKYPKQSTKSEYIKSTYIFFLIGVSLFIISCFYHHILFWALLAIFIIAVFTVILTFGIRKYKEIRVSINDYAINLETVSYIKYEEYIRRNNRVVICSVGFENGKTWRIPKDNYLWSKEMPMSDFAIYNTSHRDDTFIVVTKIKTGEIVMAYNTDIFEYSEC